MPMIGLGAVLQVDDGVANAFVAVDDVTSLNVPDQEFGTVESKRLNQTADKIIVPVVTMKSAGEFEFTYEFSATKKTRIDALRGIAHNWKIILQSDGSPTTWTATFPGTLVSNKMEAVSPDEIQHTTGKVVVTGPIVIT